MGIGKGEEEWVIFCAFICTIFNQMPALTLEKYCSYVKIVWSAKLTFGRKKNRPLWCANMNVHSLMDNLTKHLVPLLWIFVLLRFSMEHSAKIIWEAAFCFKHEIEIEIAKRRIESFEKHKQKQRKVFGLVIDTVSFVIETKASCFGYLRGLESEFFRIR